jgi:hypothetical protein
MSAAPPQGPASAPRWRFGVFIALAAVIVLGPTYGHFFARGDLKHLGWRMFYVSAVDFCAVDYYTVDEGGARLTTIDRRELLVPAGKPTPPNLWRIANVKAAEAVGRDLCGALAARGDRRVDLRLNARCGGLEGWVVGATGDHNLCEARR